MNWDKVKWARVTGATGNFTADISLYYTEYTIANIILTPLSGSPSTIKVGYSAGGDEVCFLTDISSLVMGRGICLELNQVPTQDTLYFTMPTGVFDIDVLLIQRINA